MDTLFNQKPQEVNTDPRRDDFNTLAREQRMEREMRLQDYED